MKKFALMALCVPFLAGCENVDAAFTKAKGEVVSVERGGHGKCAVTFRIEGDTRLFMTVASTPYKEMRCAQLKAGAVVPVVNKPILGNYPYIPLERVEG